VNFERFKVIKHHKELKIYVLITYHSASKFGSILLVVCAQFEAKTSECVS